MSAGDDEDRREHEFARRLGWPHAVFLPPSLYDRAKASGIDLRGYVRQRPIPLVSDNRSSRTPGFDPETRP